MIPEKSNTQGLLSSWKEIAAYLDCDERTSRRWETNFGLPVHRMEGTPKSRVYAYKEELDSWRKEKLNGVLKTNGKELPAPKRRGSKTAKMLLWLLPLLAASVAGVLFLFRPSPRQPADFRIEGSKLIILDENGNNLWDFETGLQNLWTENEYRRCFQIKSSNEEGRLQFPLLAFRDIDRDGKLEVLFAAKTDRELYETGIFCYDSRGRMLWKHKPGRELRFGDHPYSADYRILGIETFDISGNGDLEIFLITGHQPHSPSGLVALDYRGEVLGEFVNWGRISDIAFADIGGDNRKEIIIAGINDEFGQGFLAVFDRDQINGASPQGKEYACEACGTGSEEYYLLLPRTDVDRILKPDKVGTDEIHFLSDNRIELQAQISHVFFELDFNLHVKDVKGSDYFRNQHRKLKAAGKITSVLDDAYYEAIKKGVLYWNGSDWTSIPTMNFDRNSPD